MRKINFFFFILLISPILCLGGDDNCASNSRTLLPIEEFAAVVGDYISEGRIVYSLGAQKHMNERGIAENDIKYILRYPAEVAKTRFDGTVSEYNITGVPDKDENQLELWVSFEAQKKGPLTVDTINTVVRSLPKDGTYLSFGLSKQNFVHIARNTIEEGKIIYSPLAREHMNEHSVNQSDIEQTLRSPNKVKETRFDGSISEYNVIGFPNKDGKQLKLWVSLDAQSKGQLTINTVTRYLPKNRIPLSKENFIPFINDYLDKKKLVYTTNARRLMAGQNISEHDIEHVLRHPKKVGSKNTQNHALDGVRYIRGETANGNLLRLGIILTLAKKAKKRNVVVTIAVKRS